jgi:hypothetical protein
VAGQEVSDGDDAHKALESYAARGPEEVARTGLVLALAIGDGFLDSTWSTGWSRARVHLEFLESETATSCPTPSARSLTGPPPIRTPTPRRGSSTTSGHPETTAPSGIPWAGLLLARSAS